MRAFALPNDAVFHIERHAISRTFMSINCLLIIVTLYHLDILK